MEQESFRLLGESANLRVGVRSVDGKETGIEILLRLIPPGPAFDPRAVRDMLVRLEGLLDRSYQLTVQEGWWVVCEKPVAEDAAFSEGRFALDLFADILNQP